MNIPAAIRNLKGVLITYALLGVALWPVPLLNRLHAESSAIIAFAAFFVAGLSALEAFGKGAAFGRILARQEVALVVPWLLLTAAVLWAPNCAYLTGVLFFVLFPVISVVLAVAGAYALSGTKLRYKKAIFIVIGLAAAVFGPLYDLGLHPQFYTYNHVFGGVLGPLYDRNLALRPGLFVYRGLTLLWALLLFLIGQWFRVRGRQRDGQVIAQTGDRRSTSEDRDDRQRRASILYSLFSILNSPAHACWLGIAVVAVAVALCYLNAARLGFNTPAWYLQRQLGGYMRTEHFDVYYTPSTLTQEERRRLADDVEYRYAWLEAQLDMQGPRRIALYLYPNADVKARLTGARYTNVAPVWLPHPQIHLLEERYAESFGHELVHVFSRAFGLPVLNASAAVGLVEGLAVALEPPSGRPTPHEQVSAAFLSEDVPLAENLAMRLSPLGFWTGRGAVSYTTMGSFVRYLVTRYGVEKVKQVYAWADFEAVYGKPVRVLAEEWQRALMELPLVAQAAGALVSRRFAVPSLFEVRCPHYVPPALRAYRAGVEAIEASDTTRALAYFSEALERRPDFWVARGVRARLRLSRGASPMKVVQALRACVQVERCTVGMLVTLGDAYALLGRSSEAHMRYEAAADRLPLYAQEALALLILREAVAGRPAVMRALVGAGEAEAQAQRLAAFEGGAVQLLRAERLLEAGRGELALRLLRSTLLPQGLERSFERAVLTRQRLAWLARAAYEQGALARAVRYARQTASTYQAVGAHNEAAYFADLAGKYEWLSRNGRVGGGVFGRTFDLTYSYTSIRPLSHYPRTEAVNVHAKASRYRSAIPGRHPTRRLRRGRGGR